MAALLLLDGRLGPVSITLQRAAVLTVLTVLAAANRMRCGPVATSESPYAVGDLLSSGARRDGAAPIEVGGERTSVPGDPLRCCIARWIAVFAAMAIVGRAPSVPVALIGFVIALAAIEIGAERRPPGLRLSARSVPACLGYAAVRFLVDLVPQFGWVADRIAAGGCRYVRSARGLETDLSFTAMGGPAVGMAVLCLFWNWRRIGGYARLVAAVSVPLGWFAALPAVTPDVSVGTIESFARGAYHGLFWLGAAVVVSLIPLRKRAKGPAAAGGRTLATAEEGGRAPGSAVSQSPFSPDAGSACQATAGRRFRGVSRPSMTCAGLVAMLAGVCLVGTAFVGPAAGRSIRVFNHGGLDWDRPVFGQFGAFSGGMFGLWPVYCRSEGYDFGAIDRPSSVVRGPLSVVGVAGKRGPSASASETNSQRTKDDRQRTIEPADLEATQILVLINSPKVWDERERRTIYDFVARGGSLLVLGDHTDVFGLMRGFNSLLEPLGIKFRFDSAYKAREGWRGCQAAAPDAVAWGWDDENPGVAVGASLELSGWARPLLVGRYGFSDSGVRENVVGSYLGNYHHDPGERLGDVVLVATATYGRGRVVVWGDTSAFQGVSTYYPRVVGPMLAWLSRPAAWTERPAVRAVAALGLLAVIAWLWLVRGGARESAVIGAGLLVGLVVPWCLGLPHREAGVTIAGDTVLFDTSHMPATGHYNAKVNPIGPLYTNLLRSGFRVAEMEDWDRAALARARGIAFVAPQRSFTASEVRDLLDAEERGAVVVLTASQPDAAGARRLLDAHGLRLEPRPLGTVTSADPGAGRIERESHPRFLDAWPIVAADGRNPVELPGVEVIYRHGRDVVALFRRVGKGGLLLIADTRFFSDMNVEDMSGYRPGNLALIYELFHRYLGADPDAVKPLFRSPVKPQ